MKKAGLALLALALTAKAYANENEPALSFPGYVWQEVASLPSWFPENGLAHSGGAEQAMQLNRLAFWDIKPSIFASFQHSYALNGPYWMNKAAPGGGAKLVYKLGKGLLQAGVRFTYEFVQSIEPRPSAVGFVSFYYGWDLGGK